MNSDGFKNLAYRTYNTWITECLIIVVKIAVFTFCFGHTGAVLNGEHPFFLETSPRTEQGREGSSLLLRCAARGVPTPVIRWFKDGFGIINGINGIEIADGTLRIGSLKRSHGGRYTCRAQNIEGNITKDTVVYVSAAPVFIERPQEALVREGDGAEFRCVAKGYPPDITYRWYRNDELIPASSSSRRNFEVFEQREEEGLLIIQNVQITHRGKISCEASNGVGVPISATTQLRVEFKARALPLRSITYGGVRGRVMLKCPTLANPPVNTVIWRKGGRNLRIRQDPRLDTDGNGSLIIHSVRRADQGQYTCTPFNNIGSLGASNPTRLIVRNFPDFVIRPTKTVKVSVGSKLEVPCSGKGDPPPNISWRKISSKSTEKLVFCVNGGNLSVDAIRKQHHGAWQCVLSNVVGDVTTDVMVVVTSSTPQDVENVSAVAWNETSVRVSWTPGFDGGFSQHFVVWHKRADKGDHAWRKTYVTGDKSTVVVKQLQSSTIYHFSVAPKNVYGVGSFSKTIAVKTRGNVVVTTPHPPQTISAPSKLTSSTGREGRITLRWSYVEEALGFLVEYRKLKSDPNVEQEQLASSFEQVSVTRTNRKTQNGDDVERIAPLRASSRVKRSSSLPSNWVILDTTLHNVTSYELQPNQVYRDQIYEFQVLAMTGSEYSEPSSSLTLSTQGLAAYPCYLESPDPVIILDHPIVIGCISALLFVCLLVIVIVAYVCRKKSLNGKLPTDSYDENGIPRNANKESYEVTGNHALRHMVTNDGYTSSMSYLGCHRDDDVTSPGEKNDEKNFDVVIHEDAEEKKLLSPSSPSYQEDEGKEWCERVTRRRSKDEESVKMRRQTVARVLFAQRAEREKVIAGMRDSDSAPGIRRPSSTTPFYSAPHQREHSSQSTRHASTISSNRSVFIPQLSLEDRRRQEEPCIHEESVFGIVATPSLRQERELCPHPNYHQRNCSTTIYQPTGQQSQYMTSSVQNMFSSCYDYRPEKYDVTCCSTLPLIDVTSQNVPPKTSSTTKHNSQRQSREQKTTSSIRGTRAASVSPDRMHGLRRPRSRASYSFEPWKDPTYRHSFHRSPDKNEMPSFEIDCSGSNIEVRCIKTSERRFDDNAFNDRSLRYATYKVGSNNLDQATEIPFLQRPSTMKVQMRRHSKEQRKDRQKRASLDSILSPSHNPTKYRIEKNSPSKRVTLPRSGSRGFEDSGGNTNRKNLRSQHESTRNGRRSTENGSGFESPGLDFPENPSSPPKTSTPVQPHRYKSEIVVEPESPSKENLTKRQLSSDCLQRLLGKHNGSSTSPEKNSSLSQVTKPTVISLSDIPWESTKLKRTSSSLFSPLSSLSPSVSPKYSSSSHFSVNQNNNNGEIPSTSGGDEMWGSLGRSGKLKKLSLPFTTTSSPAISSLSTTSGELMEANRSLGRDTESSRNERSRTPKHKPGIRSVPVSPIKKFSPSKLPARSRAASCTATDSRDNKYSSDMYAPISKTKIISILKNSPQVMSTPSTYVVSPASLLRHTNLGEITSSGYVTQDTTQSSLAGGKNSSERTRRDNSSVEDNYEWDSEYAMEFEILEALRNFESIKPTSSMSEELRDELTKFACDAVSGRYTLVNEDQNRCETSEHSSSPLTETTLLSSDTNEATYTKESMERRYSVIFPFYPPRL
ncbi:unnamed protein product [Clavelina lepadiformis]|uniref:Uncharacterized protein n=1 Tax=Clavelina lepadiformis TaxID=159417 RepID=A0ABP0GP87_CLALP